MTAKDTKMQNTNYTNNSHTASDTTHHPANNLGRTREEDALYIAWSDDRQSASPQSLRTWIERYPEHRRALIDWATEEPVVEAHFQVVQPDPQAEARSLAIGKQVLAEMRASYFAQRTAVAEQKSAITDLVHAAKAQGLTAKVLAAKLGIGLTLMAKLNQRLLQIATLPDTLIERLAVELKTGAAEIRAYLARPATLASAAQYKSDGVPQVAQTETFKEALRVCNDMTAEEKQFWLSQN